MSILSALNRDAQFRRSEKHSPGEARYMDCTGLGILRNSDGKGIIGCIVLIVLIGTAIYLAITLVPIYYTNHTFESEVEAEVSRAGAQSLNDETILEHILALAQKYEISLTREDIIVDRYAGQVHVEVNYARPVSFGFFKRGMNFQISASSFMRTP